ncbi:putative transporter C1529,01 OS=Schizosaccharomyces pombe (strain 972 / ATCC 24843) GN=SPCC1529.01 PE=3 SV=2 [Rhizoctonia solani AG-1 IB]|uniref:Putative transporter C1529,01 n=1 Tax=Thanatephorus cucumeris (strain AG1-IB / isolate 7/3/14) TaxID=1108050 RepID=A0A0B7G166_THACB|nr:putative transporter C1529,01 OS=Schizosaccharomyces pombe (strain 972 / ATCC 24843) GN=SPCC1529.01 PE=3 SV=2 [Rhizoctonia solani AG-1 IB]
MAESHPQTATMPTPELEPPPAFEIETGNSRRKSLSKDSKDTLSRVEPVPETAGVTASPTLIKSDEDLHAVNGDPSHPTLWPKWKKRRVLFVVCAYYFLFTFITTVTVPTFNDLQTYFVISYEQVTYTVAVPALALAVSPFFWTPLAEALGRRTVMVLGCLVAMLASLGVALETTYKGYMIFRFLQGWGVGPASTVGLQMLEDIYLEHERGQKVGYWCLSIDIGRHHSGHSGEGSLTPHKGLLFGPLIGGFAALASWNFPNWLTVIKTAVYPIQLPQYSVQPPSPLSQPTLPTKALPWLNFRTLLTRPKPWDSMLHFLRLFAFPNIALTIMFYCWTWYWFILCVITMLPGAYPDYNPQVQGLLFLGFIVGTLISEMLFSGGLSDYLVQRAMERTNGERVPEKRLLLCFPAAVLSTIGLVLFGCTVQFNWHWFIAQIATFLIGTGVQIGNTTTISYVVDAYPQHVMDVTLFYTFHLNLSAFASPFFIVPW